MSDAHLVASRYAQALSDAVTEIGEFDRVKRELRVLSDLVTADDELRHALANPVIGVVSKGRVLAEIVKRSEFSPRTARFVAVLAERERLALLGEIASAVEEVYDHRTDVHEVEITSAAPLADDLRERLTSALGKVAGGRIRISESVDPELLGGVVARVGSTVFDGSLKTRLQALHSKMTGRGARGNAAG